MSRGTRSESFRTEVVTQLEEKLGRKRRDSLCEGWGRGLRRQDLRTIRGLERLSQRSSRVSSE